MSTSSINRATPATSLPSKVNANSVAVQVFNRADSVLLPVVLTAPGGGVLEQKKFLVRGSGYCTTAGAYTVVVGLYAGIVAPTLAAPGTLIAVSTARAVGTTSCPWWVEADLIFDSVSGKLQGVQSAMVNNLYDARVALAAVVAGINGAVGSGEPAIYFALGITFNTGNVANIGVCSDFVLDA
jgi:hypothetical protein